MKTVVLYGLCAKTPALLDEVVKMFLGAQIEHPGVGDCAKGAALLLAGSRGLLSALPVSTVPVDCLVASSFRDRHETGVLGMKGMQLDGSSGGGVGNETWIRV